ncbi:TPA: dTDP-4-dehydrorhamnose 3,5-epimerase [Escherichia coli]
MKITKTHLLGCIVIEPKVFRDARGFFVETYQKEKYQEIGITEDFVQDNRSRSAKGVLRGLHFQTNQPQGKLVSVTSGAVYDVAVDLRPESATFGSYFGLVLSEELNNQLYIPPGFAHGFCVLSDSADFLYKCTQYYNPASESGIQWNDPTLKINWPISNPFISEKDSTLPSFKDYMENYAQ